jgi:hypothetical protein
VSPARGGIIRFRSDPRRRGSSARKDLHGGPQRHEGVPAARAEAAGWRPLSPGGGPHGPAARAGRARDGHRPRQARLRRERCGGAPARVAPPCRPAKPSASHAGGSRRAGARARSRCRACRRVERSPFRAADRARRALRRRSLRPRDARRGAPGPALRGDRPGLGSERPAVRSQRRLRSERPAVRSQRRRLRSQRRRLRSERPAVRGARRRLGSQRHSAVGRRGPAGRGSEPRRPLGRCSRGRASARGRAGCVGSRARPGRGGAFGRGERLGCERVSG